MTITLDMASFDEATQELIVDRAARYLATALAAQQQQAVVHKGIKGLATRLQCSEATAAELLASQRIKYSRLGKKGYRITETDVLAYLESK